jgi:hypothetical protein
MHDVAVVGQSMGGALAVIGVGDGDRRLVLLTHSCGYRHAVRGSGISSCRFAGGSHRDRDRFDLT